MFSPSHSRAIVRSSQLLSKRGQMMESKYLLVLTRKSDGGASIQLYRQLGLLQVIVDSNNPQIKNSFYVVHCFTKVFLCYFFLVCYWLYLKWDGLMESCIGFEFSSCVKCSLMLGVLSVIWWNVVCTVGLALRV